ncbi:MAG: glucosaminidase domain-containing protein [Bacteroidetes bacterium]|nr:glucosaminidase domain-containing protein [Bacteroidota bacterium]
MQFSNSNTTKWNGRPERRSYNYDYQSRHDINRRNKRNKSGISLAKILRFIGHALQRLFVVLKYRLSRLEIGRIRLPWFQLTVAAILIYLIFQRDLQFQIHMNAPGQQTSARTESTAAGTGMDLSRSLVADKKEAVTPPPAPVEEKDPFEPVVGDSDAELAAKSYIRRFRQVAAAEMKKFDIPASIKMGQALLESHAGKSRLAVKLNNHFGIKCFSRSCAKGHCTNFPDDHHKDFFRKYESAWAGWRAHSEFLTKGSYKDLQKHGLDYKAWAKGLSEIGYATDPNYADKLINIIEKYQLHRLDRP